MITSPTRVPTIEPRPPLRLAPPSTIAVTTDSSMPMPKRPEPTPSCDVRMMPLSAQAAAERMKPKKMKRFESTPTSRAADGFEPIAYIERPYTV